MNSHLLHKCKKHVNSHKFCKAPNIVYQIPTSCCEFDSYTKLPANPDAEIPALQSLFISTTTLKILAFLHEGLKKFGTHIIHVKKKLIYPNSQTPFTA